MKPSSSNSRRTLTGTMTQDEGQERQEAKTEDCQEDKTSGDVIKRKWNQHGLFRLKEKQGVLAACKDCKTR